MNLTGKKFKLCREPKCRRRGLLLDLESFYKHQGGKFGRRAICKECFHIRYGKKLEERKRRRDYYYKSVLNNLTQEQKNKALDEFHFRCALTDNSEDVQLDHFIPLSWGSITRQYGIGGNTYSNMLPLDGYLNTSKSSDNPFVWIKTAGDKFNIDENKWDRAIEYIAMKHNLSLTDFENRVNNCYVHLTTKRAIINLNQALNNGKRKNMLYYLDSYLKSGINIQIAVNLFGSEKAKKYLSDRDTQDYLKNAKNKLAQN
jgi:hypothetical protein